MEQKEYTSWLKRIFTPRRLKLGAVLVVVCAMVAGGGAWYYHQQKMERKAQIQQAQTRMVEYQAAQRNVQLIGVDDIKAIAAQAVGKDAADLRFREISLENKWDDGDYRNARRDRRPRDVRPAVAAPAQGNGQGQAVQAAPGQHDGWTRQEEFFLPIYEIECDGDGLGYELEINAITGEGLESEVESYSIFDEL